MLVLPASEHLDLAVAQRVLGVADLVRLGAPEVRALFPDCDPDALPPFGARAGLPVVLDLCFFEEAEEEEDGGEIYFEAGNHREIGVMRFADFRRLAGPFAHEACLHEKPRLARTVKHGGRGSLA